MQKSYLPLSPCANKSMKGGYNMACKAKGKGKSPKPKK